MKKFYMNTTTGEVVKKFTKIGAYIYFKKDSKIFNYSLKRADIVIL